MLSLDLHNPNFWFDVYDIKHPSHVYEIFRKNEPSFKGFDFC